MNHLFTRRLLFATYISLTFISDIHLMHVQSTLRWCNVTSQMDDTRCFLVHYENWEVVLLLMPGVEQPNCKFIAPSLPFIYILVFVVERVSKRVNIRNEFLSSFISLRIYLSSRFVFEQMVWSCLYTSSKNPKVSEDLVLVLHTSLLFCYFQGVGFEWYSSVLTSARRWSNQLYWVFTLCTCLFLVFSVKKKSFYKRSLSHWEINGISKINMTHLNRRGLFISPETVPARTIDQSSKTSPVFSSQYTYTRP